MHVFAGKPAGLQEGGGEWACYCAVKGRVCVSALGDAQVLSYV